MAGTLLVAVCAAAIAVAIFLAGDRLRPESWRQSGDETSGALALDLVKTFFTAVVAFIFIVCWQQHQSAHDHTVAEAKGLLDTYWAAQALPPSERTQVQSLVRGYTGQVIEQEWPLMENRGRLSESAADTLATLRETAAALRSPDPIVTDARSRTLAGLDQVVRARGDRAIDLNRNIPQFLYLTLYFGTALVLLNPVLTGIRVTWRSVTMIALLGIVVGCALLALRDMERPFSSVMGISKDAFVYTQSQIEQPPSEPGDSAK
ncbi:DUF4239 domain-containing protein [Nocardia arthritidis]|uniref:DUF4239 domain-containing protein n=1 Tax=Nocardia arthritidis TaxID=228602 RepID=A0A6G9YMX4_9NOCA|nr:DUF4239 domain-containing protein [Nocardia arthritidis]QIS14531.1 DUF4239 domain-containing protein [Nocardia arthritidis]